MSHYTIIELEDFMPPQHVNAIEDLLESILIISLLAGKFSKIKKII